MTLMATLALPTRTHRVPYFRLHPLPRVVSSARRNRRHGRCGRAVGSRLPHAAARGGSRSRRRGFSASLRYQQQPGRSNLALDGPLGIGGLRVDIEGEDIAIATSRGEKLDGQAARDELERRLGFQLPLTELRWWLLGIPAPGEASVNQDGGSGEIRDFTQNGWHVSINSRAASLGFALPQRLTAEREGARLKLLVENWQP